jgi:hypothetical protein
MDSQFQEENEALKPILSLKLEDEELVKQIRQYRRS